jgi:signal peptidase I
MSTIPARVLEGRDRRDHHPRSRAARVAAFTGNLAVVVLLLLSVAYVLPSLLGYERYVITGGSMTGTYDKGSIVFEKVVPTAGLRVGDVITYVPPASSGVTNLVTHRIIEAEPGPAGTVYRTKGDANPSIDPWTFSLDRPEQAVVQFHAPHAGWVLLYLADPGHRKLLVGIPAGLVALLSIGEAIRNGRRERQPATGRDLSVPTAGEPAPVPPVATDGDGPSPTLAQPVGATSGS